MQTEYVTTLVSWRRLLLWVLSTAALGGMIGYAHADLEEERVLRRSMAGIKVVTPETPPELSQESIDLALELYGIEVPSSVEHPTFDPTLEDRGLTTRATFLDHAKVTIGPSAFASWSLLGSTLAHEVEVHCHQSFAVIWFLDILQMDGVKIAEREAYAHEVEGAARFGLKLSEVQLINETVDYYYPEHSDNKDALSGSMLAWLAQQFLSARHPM